MRSIIVYLFCGVAFMVFSLPLSGMAQRKGTPVSLGTENNSFGSFPAFSLTVEGANEKLAIAEWRKLIKEFGGKAKKIKGEWTAENVYINAVCGTEPITVYATIEGRKTGRAEVVAWFQCRGNYVGDGSAARDVVETFDIMEEFYDDLLYAAIDLECEEERRVHEKLEKKLKNLERDLAGYERDIERAKEIIARAEENIVKNGEAQEKTREDIDKQIEVTKACEDRRDAVRQ